MVNDRMFFPILKNIQKYFIRQYMLFSIVCIFFIFRWNSLCVKTCSSIQELTSVFQASYLVTFINYNTLVSCFKKEMYREQKFNKNSNTLSFIFFLISRYHRQFSVVFLKAIDRCIWDGVNSILKTRIQKQGTTHFQICSWKQNSIWFVHTS